MKYHVLSGWPNKAMDRVSKDFAETLTEHLEEILLNGDVPPVDTGNLRKSLTNHHYNCRTWHGSSSDRPTIIEGDPASLYPDRNKQEQPKLLLGGSRQHE